jgi:hypothetical protein
MELIKRLSLTSACHFSSVKVRATPTSPGAM